MVGTSPSVGRLENLVGLRYEKLQRRECMTTQYQPGKKTAGLTPSEERAILTVTCLAAFLFFNSFGSISVALPVIQKQFGNGLAEIQWITLMGVVTISSLSFCFGRAGGIFGQRLLYKIGVALSAPLYLQNVLGASAVASGLLLAILPLSIALASPLSGRLADRIDASTLAGIGIAMIVAGIACYSRLGIESRFFVVAAVLALLGAGVGCFTPANQKLAFASASHEDYGVLAAMLSSFATAAGTIGTTFVVALMEMDGGRDLWASKEVFSRAQQFAFAWLVPIGLVAIVVTFRSRRSVGVQGSAKGIVGPLSARETQEYSSRQ